MSWVLLIPCVSWYVNWQMQVPRETSKPQPKYRDFHHYLPNNIRQQRHRGTQVLPGSVLPHRQWGGPHCLHHTHFIRRLCFHVFSPPSGGSSMSVRVSLHRNPAAQIRQGMNARHKWSFPTLMFLVFPAARWLWWNYSLLTKSSGSSSFLPTHGVMLSGRNIF